MQEKQYINQIRESEKLLADKIAGLHQFADKGNRTLFNKYRRELKEGYETQQAIRRGIVEQILKLDDQNQQKVLLLRYIAGMGWKEIASYMFYSIRHAHRISKEALNALEHLPH